MFAIVVLFCIAFCSFVWLLQETDQQQQRRQHANAEVAAAAKAERAAARRAALADAVLRDEAAKARQANIDAAGIGRQLADGEAAERRAEKEAAERQRAEREAAERQRQAEKEAAERQRAEREAAERQRQAEKEAAERQRQAEQEAAERQQAEQEAAERLRAAWEAAERQQAEQEAAERLRAEQEAAERLRAEQEAAERQAEREAAERLPAAGANLRRRVVVAESVGSCTGGAHVVPGSEAGPSRWHVDTSPKGTGRLYREGSHGNWEELPSKAIWRLCCKGEDKRLHVASGGVVVIAPLAAVFAVDAVNRQLCLTAEEHNWRLEGLAAQDLGLLLSEMTQSPARERLVAPPPRTPERSDGAAPVPPTPPQPPARPAPVTAIPCTPLEPAPPRAPRKRALLCACTYSGEESLLGGPCNGAATLKKMLEGCPFGFQPANIRLLVDTSEDPSCRPTRQNMHEGLRWLMSDLLPGDRLVFFFGGHGGQQREQTYICPTDHYERGIIDDKELNRTLVQPLPKGVRLTAVLDCCHAGNMLLLPYRASVQQGRAEWNAVAGGQGTAGGTVLQISACEADQVSYVKHSKITAGVSVVGDTWGRATYTIKSVIQQHSNADGKITLEKLLVELHKKVVDKTSDRSRAKHGDTEPSLASSHQFDLSGR